MKYLVTDPCYIVSNEDWSKLGEKTGWGDNFIEALKSHTINGVGKIIECDQTQFGDGSCQVKTATGKEFEIGVDAGLVCIAQVSNTYKLPKRGLGAVTPDLQEAVNFYEKALLI